jgi:serine/threonine protein kinase
MSPQQTVAATKTINDLVGTKLDSGWVITKQLPRPGTPGAEELTGSYFSIGYIASNGKKEAFVKVIDIHTALKHQPGTTLMERLKGVADSHTFECAVLDVCSKAKLDRVVQVLSQGEMSAIDDSGIPIPYIMFELADGDVRKIISRTNKVDDAWRLKVLHDVAVGLQQLHGQSIAHQDLKPSNVLLFEQESKGAKIGDLGRSSRKGMDVSHNGNKIAGALAYAPPEQVYGISPERWEDRREGCDLYHLGSLTTFLFSGTTPTDFYVQNLSKEIRPGLWQGMGSCEYSTALPVLTSAFSSFVVNMKKDFPDWAAEELSQIVINACNPDFSKRGDPDARNRAGSPIGIDTFVSRFDRLSKRAMVETRK